MLIWWQLILGQRVISLLNTFLFSWHRSYYGVQVYFELAIFLSQLPKGRDYRSVLPYLIFSLLPSFFVISMWRRHLVMLPRLALIFWTEAPTILPSQPPTQLEIEACPETPSLHFHFQTPPRTPRLSVWVSGGVGQSVGELESACW